VERVKWRTVDDAETQRIDEQYQLIRTAISDEAQRRLMMDMLFEQMKLRVNMSSVVSYP
jgi:hypothetical protein